MGPVQAVKAAGVTFADSMVERVIEEQAKGDSARAEAIRARLAPVIGDSLRGVPAGSEKAREVAYHFVMAHEYEDTEHRREEKWTH